MVELGNTKEEDIKRDVFATVNPITVREFVAAGQRDKKPEAMFLVYQEEYKGEEEIHYNDKRLSIYRTYGPKDDGKIELYAEDRKGNYGNSR